MLPESKTNQNSSISFEHNKSSNISRFTKNVANLYNELSTYYLISFFNIVVSKGDLGSDHSSLARDKVN